MIKPTAEILQEAIEDTDELIEYVLSSSGDPNLPEWLEALKKKIVTVQLRLSKPVKQQSDFEEVKSCIEAGKLPPLGSAKTGIQYINSNK